MHENASDGNLALLFDGRFVKTLPHTRLKTCLFAIWPINSTCLNTQLVRNCVINRYNLTNNYLTRLAACNLRYPHFRALHDTIQFQVITTLDKSSDLDIENTTINGNGINALGNVKISNSEINGTVYGYTLNAHDVAIVGTLS